MGDLNSRRAAPARHGGRGDGEVIRAEVPMAEMLSYAPDLRAMTGGRGDYTMEFDHYAQVPAHIAEKAAAARVGRGSVPLRWPHAGRAARRRR